MEQPGPTKKLRTGSPPPTITIRIKDQVRLTSSPAGLSRNKASVTAHTPTRLLSSCLLPAQCSAVLHGSHGTSTPPQPYLRVDTHLHPVPSFPRPPRDPLPRFSPHRFPTASTTPTTHSPLLPSLSLIPCMQSGKETYFKLKLTIRMS